LVACFFMGTASGGATPAAFALASEYIPARVRGQVILVMGIMGSVGGYTGAAMIASIAKTIWADTYAWRFQWLSGVVPITVLFFFSTKLVPESARYLIGRGKIAEAKIAAETMIGSIQHILEGADLPKMEVEITSDSNSEAAQPRKQVQGMIRLDDETAVEQETILTKLLSHMRGYNWMISKMDDLSWVHPTVRPYINFRFTQRTIGLCVYGFAWGFAYYGWSVWVPTVLKNSKFTTKLSAIYLCVASLLAFVLLPLTYFLFTRWSRRKMLFLYAWITALSLLVLGIGEFYKASEFNVPFVIIVNTVVLFALNSVGAAFLPYVSELFPTHIRGGRSGVVGGASKLGGLIAIYSSGQWIGHGHPILGMMVFYCFLLIVASFVLYVTVVETQGKTLEKINLDDIKNKELSVECDSTSTTTSN